MAVLLLQEDGGRHERVEAPESFRKGAGVLR